jgi:hypothetical protein
MLRLATGSKPFMGEPTIRWHGRPVSSLAVLANGRLAGDDDNNKVNPT